MFKRIAFFTYGSLSYLLFLGTFLYAIGFIGNFGVPRTRTARRVNHSASRCLLMSDC